MLNIYTFSLPYAPPSTNVWMRWHRHRQTQEKRQWQHDVTSLVNQVGNKAPRGIERVRLHAVITFPVSRGRDADNYGMPLWKWTQDALVLAGVLVNDTADRCQSFPPMLVGGQEESTLVIMEW